MNPTQEYMSNTTGNEKTINSVCSKNADIFHILHIFASTHIGIIFYDYLANDFLYLILVSASHGIS